MTVLLIAQAPIAYASAAAPVAVDGRILPAAKAGDSSAWIEIARYNGYSLILRQTPITNNLTTYSSSVNNNTYSASIARAEINTWYRSKLGSTARLRSYAVKSNAMTNLGSVYSASVDGISTPTATASPTGDDTVFLLSQSEAMYYCSTQYVVDGPNPASTKPTSAIAYNNFNKLLPKYKNADIAPAYWLRSPGMYYYAAGCVAYTGGSPMDLAVGRAYQHTIIGTYGHYRPALWVGSGIFEEKGTINLNHEDSESGGLLLGYQISVDPGLYGPYGPENIAGYDYVGLKPGSDPISGTIAEGQTKNITHLYKKKPAEYTVTYYPNYGVGLVKDYTETAGNYHTVTDQGYYRTNYTFSGWNTNAGGGGVSYKNGDQILINGNVSLYAQWTPVPDYYVIYTPNGGNGFANMFSAPGGTNHTVFDQGYYRDKYSQNGWNTMPNGTGTHYNNGDVILVTNNIVLYAEWKEIPVPDFTVTYYANNGSGASKPYSVTPNTIYTITDQGFLYNGYTFKYWNTKSDGSGVTYYNNSAIYVTGDVELYAQWEKDSHKQMIVYSPNGGVGAIQLVWTDDDGKATILSDTGLGYTRDYYEFKNWNTIPDGSGVTYTPGQQVTLDGDLFLYAQWTYVPPTYKVLYDPSEGWGGSIDSDLALGSQYTIKTGDEAQVHSYLAGYIVKEWTTEPEGKGEVYVPGQKITITSKDILLYAVWTYES